MKKWLYLFIISLYLVPVLMLGLHPAFGLISIILLLVSGLFNVVNALIIQCKPNDETITMKDISGVFYVACYSGIKDKPFMNPFEDGDFSKMRFELEDCRKAMEGELLSAPVKRIDESFVIELSKQLSEQISLLSGFKTSDMKRHQIGFALGYSEPLVLHRYKNEQFIDMFLWINYSFYYIMVKCTSLYEDKRLLDPYEPLEAEMARFEILPVTPDGARLSSAIDRIIRDCTPVPITRKEESGLGFDYQFICSSYPDVMASFYTNETPTREMLSEMKEILDDFLEYSSDEADKRGTDDVVHYVSDGEIKKSKTMGRLVFHIDFGSANPELIFAMLDYVDKRFKGIKKVVLR